TGRISLRTVPRNFPGRSGTPEDQVYLVSPETAAACALTGLITDPRTLEMEYPRIAEPEDPVLNASMVMAPLPPDQAATVELIKGPNIQSLPEFTPLADRMTLPVLLKMGDDISTDEILPAGTRVLPYRSNIPKISEFAFERVDPRYHQRAMKIREAGGHAVVGGNNYGQGSSREHAALAPYYLGLRVVIAKSFARIHWQNLTNFGILPVTFANPSDYAGIDQEDRLELTNLHAAIKSGAAFQIINTTQDKPIPVQHDLSQRQIEMLLRGGLINWLKSRP
ncbi:MAG: aconitate hydratase, partial [Pseudomonadota bacterium]